MLQSIAHSESHAQPASHAAGVVSHVQIASSVSSARAGDATSTKPKTQAARIDIGASPIAAGVPRDTRGDSRVYGARGAASRVACPRSCAGASARFTEAIAIHLGMPAAIAAD